MRINIMIDDELMTDILKLTGIKSKREAVEEGLRILLALKQQEKIKQFKSDSDFTTAKSLMCALPVHNMAGREISLRSVDNLRLLCKKGITIRKTIDVLIALTVLKIS